MQEQIEIVMASDDNYVSLLICALCSLFENNRMVKLIRVFVIADNISNENLENLQWLFKKYDRCLVLLDPPEFDNRLVIRGGLNKSTYYRLMLTELLPEEVNKVLYLDCDVLIRNSIEELWSTDLDDSLIAGVIDTTDKYARESVELDKNENYVNAGVLLINLKMWRLEGITIQFIDYLEKKNWKVEFNDQGVINHICNRRILIINPKYDFMPPYYRYSYEDLKKIVGSNVFYTAQQVETAKKNPIIIHYAGYAFSRPWFKNNNAIFQEEFKYYQKLSGVQLKQNKQPDNYKYKMRKFANSCPDKICILINKSIDFAYRASRKIKE